jgi:spore maturation protein CgeB
MEEDVTKRQMAYSIGSYLTYIERLSLLRLLGSRCDMHLFSSKIKEETKPLLKDITIHDWVSYDSGMPQVFKDSKINLNPSLRIIRSGISLRCMDILGCGGFLLSSYQLELAEYFVPDEEVVLYDSMEDAVAKTMFYLEHDDIRQAIARNGYEKVKSEFTYPKQLQTMFDTAGLK